MKQRTPRGLTALVAAFVVSACTVSALAAQLDQHNVVIVLDASGSMGDDMRNSKIQKMNAAKAALKEVLSQVPMDTNIGLLVFSSVENRSGWIYPLGPRDDTRLMEAIDLPLPGGKTPLGRYIKIAADRLLQQRQQQFGYGTYRLLIVTDGEAGDLELVEQCVPEVIARGITMDVIGVDMATDHTLATRVHSYRRADDPESLKRAIAEVFAEVSDEGTDASAEEAFDILAGIPDELASAMLKALSSSGNQPIGESAAIPAATAPRQAQTRPQTPVAQSPPRSDSSQKPAGKQFLYLPVVIFIVLFALFRLFRRRAR